MFPAVLHPSMTLAFGYDANLDAHVAELGGVTVMVGTAGEIAALCDDWAHYRAILTRTCRARSWRRRRYSTRPTITMASHPARKPTTTASPTA